MPAAARVGDASTHGGTITGPGVGTVLVGGMPAAVVGDQHVCVIPANTGHLVTSSFPSGSGTVLIGGKASVRVSDACLCGAKAVLGEPSVVIN
jgi:uncharacterized Zn-binding protein involved in type VI secretion